MRVDRRDVDLALAALDLAEPHDAVDLRDRRRILRTTRLEQLGDSRQTARDVARLVRLAADLRDDRARRRCCCPSSTVSCAPTGMTKSRRRFSLPPFVLHDLDVRVELLLAILDDDALAETGELVELLGHRLVLDDVDEAHRAFDVGDDRVRVRIPGEDHLVPLHVVAVLHHQDRAERHLEARARSPRSCRSTT